MDITIRERHLMAIETMSDADKVEIVNALARKARTGYADFRGASDAVCLVMSVIIREFKKARRAEVDNG